MVNEFTLIDNNLYYIVYINGSDKDQDVMPFVDRVTNVCHFQKV